MAQVQRGELLSEGKTKRVYAVVHDEHLAILEAKDDITAGNCAKQHIMQGKAAIATATTCNVFRFLQKQHSAVPLAFVEQLSPTSFVAKRCSMLPFEVVIRREAFGGYLKRHPLIEKGERFPEVKSEIFLKTSGQRFKNYGLPVDDPLLGLIHDHGRFVHVYHPDIPIDAPNAHLLTIPIQEIVENQDAVMLFDWMSKVAIVTFLQLEKAWVQAGGKLVDFKVEFGLDYQSNLLLADVIDNDSWRVIINKEHIDKQLYRDDQPLDAVAKSYARVAELTAAFVA